MDSPIKIQIIKKDNMPHIFIVPAKGYPVTIQKTYIINQDALITYINKLGENKVGCQPEAYSYEHDGKDGIAIMNKIYDARNKQAQLGEFAQNEHDKNYMGCDIVKFFTDYQYFVQFIDIDSFNVLKNEILGEITQSIEISGEIPGITPDMMNGMRKKLNDYLLLEKKINNPNKQQQQVEQKDVEIIANKRPQHPQHIANKPSPQKGVCPNWAQNGKCIFTERNNYDIDHVKDYLHPGLHDGKQKENSIIANDPPLR